MNERPGDELDLSRLPGRNTTRIPTDVEAGRIVDVRCRACETEHEASVFFALTQAGAPMTVGVVWV